MPALRSIRTPRSPPLGGDRHFRSRSIVKRREQLVKGRGRRSGRPNGSGGSCQAGSPVSTAVGGMGPALSTVTIYRSPDTRARVYPFAHGRCMSPARQQSQHFHPCRSAHGAHRPVSGLTVIVRFLWCPHFRCLKTSEAEAT